MVCISHFNALCRISDQGHSGAGFQCSAMTKRLLHAVLFSFLLGSAASYSVAASTQTLVLRGGSVYASPDAAPLPDEVVVV
jgi:hypothetical protein